MKTCLECKLDKDLDEYHQKRGKPQAKCKRCRSKYMAKRYQDNIVNEKAKRKSNYTKNKEQILAATKAFYAANADEINLKRRLKKYGLTKTQYFGMLEAQANRCANKSCKSENSELVIDHCHYSQIVRGILCTNCNTALGLLKENLAAIDGLKDYIVKYKK